MAEKCFACTVLQHQIQRAPPLDILSGLECQRAGFPVETAGYALPDSRGTSLEHEFPLVQDHHERADSFFAVRHDVFPFDAERNRVLRFRRQFDSLVRHRVLFQTVVGQRHGIVFNLHRPVNFRPRYRFPVIRSVEFRIPHQILGGKTKHCRQSDKNQHFFHKRHSPFIYQFLSAYFMKKLNQSASTLVGLPKKKQRYLEFCPPVGISFIPRYDRA